MADMEEEVKRLRQENQLLTLDLQGQLYNAPEKEDKRIKHLNRIREMMNNKNTTEEEIGKVMNEYIEEWSDYGNDRRNQIQFHIEKLKQLLLPLRVLSLCESGATVNNCKINSKIIINNNKPILKNKNDIFSILNDITSSTSSSEDPTLSSSSTSSVTSCNSVSTTTSTASISSTTTITTNSPSIPTNTTNTVNTNTSTNTSSHTSNNSLWKLLCGAIDITEEQRHAIQSLSINDVQKQRHKVGECVKLLNDLKEKVYMYLYIVYIE